MEEEKKKRVKINKKYIAIIITFSILALISIIFITTKKKSVQEDLQVSNNEITSSKVLTEKSNNSFGMRFTFNVEEFESRYLKTLENNFSEYKNLLEKEQIDKKFFKPAGSKNYEFNQTNYDEQGQIIKYFSIFLEPENTENNYIDFIQINAVTGIYENISEIAENNIFYAFMAVDNSISYEKAKNIYYEMSMSAKNYVSNENITFAFNIDSDIGCTIIDIYPFNEEQYETYLSQQVNNNDNTDIINEINSKLSELNTNYGVEFTPTDEQMKEIIEFYNIYNEMGDFNADTLLSFLNQRGLIAEETGKNDNTEVNNSNMIQNNNSNKTNTSQTNTSQANSSNNDNQKKEFKDDLEVTLNINLEELIAKNELAKEIKEKYPTIFIHVYVEDTMAAGAGNTELFEYWGGGESLPKNIITKRTIYEGTGYFMGKIEVDTFKNRSEKREVRITMDNTSTMIVETTLFEGEMIFDKEGTYEIK